MHLRPLPVEAARNIGKALQVQGGSDEDVVAISRFLLAVKAAAPFDGPVWAGTNLWDTEASRWVTKHVHILVGG